MKYLLHVLCLLNITICFGDNKMNMSPPMTRYLVKKKAISDENFIVLDVGASGGIERHWSAFDQYLRAYGFDPLTKEVERLNINNKNKKIKYYPYFIVSNDEDTNEYTPNNPVIGRSSAVEATRLLNTDYRLNFNNNEPLSWTDQKISLDQFCENENIKSVDFIKTDTDGHDIKVLIGAQKTLQNKNLLGLFVECDLVEKAHPYSNSFRNIDSLLVNANFTLFNLDVRRYTRKHLPGKFLYNIQAQTDTGQVAWADALYLRDFAAMKQAGKQIPTSQILKMACIMEIYGLPDCAAELLLTFQDQVSKEINLSHCLDLLTVDMGLSNSYENHILDFQKNPEKFYP